MKKWKRIVDNTLRGAFGEIDFDRRIIRINKERHKKKHLVRKTKPSNPNPDGTEKLLDTILHEELHAKHPSYPEWRIVRLSQTKLKTMTAQEKKRLYNLYT